MEPQKPFTQNEHFSVHEKEEKQEKVQAEKNKKKWYKRARYWVIFSVGVIIAIGIIVSISRDRVEYITETVMRKNLIQTVSATGTVESDIERDLHFETTGVIDKIFVEVGDEVKEGDMLAKLDTTDFDIQLREAESALSVAQANLNIILAGSTSQDINVSRENVNSAQTIYDNTIRDHTVLLQKLNDDVKDAETKLTDTKNSQAQAVSDARQNLLTAMTTALITANQSLDDITVVLDDDLLGPTFSIQNSQNGNNARSSYADSLAKVSVANSLLSTAKAIQSDQNISQATTSILTALDAVRLALDFTFAALGDSIANSNFTDDQITTYKSNIIAEQSNNSSSISSVESADQGYANAKLTQTSTVNTAENSLNTILSNKEVQLAASQAKIDTAAASLNLAKAQLNLKQARPRAVDVSLYRSQVEQARAKVDLLKNQASDYFLFAPKSGVITFINYKEGEIPSNVGSQTGQIQPVISLVGEEQFQIKVDIPESDIIKIEQNDSASITLDAYSEDQKFTGIVKTIDIAGTIIQDVVYYKVTVGMNPTELAIKSGMTANVDIITSRRPNVLVMPQRAVIEENGRRYVRLLVNGEVVQTDVSIGIRGDEGEIEIVSGLEEGDEVIIFERSRE